MSRTDPMIGQVVGGRYQVTTLLGKGGMGAVYAVRHLKVARTFAMKVLSAEVLDDAEVVARFQREAEIIASLRHPNIVEIVDWDATPDGAPYMVMEHLRGEELSARLATRGPLPWPFIAQIADEVLSALVVAHRAGIVHRDMKPDNVFLAMDDTGEEHAKLLDFGVSKMGGTDSKLTGFNRLIGTPAYMSPEQADGRTHETGPETDVWAMGSIVYEMATGQMAFGAATVPSILYRICHDTPDPMRAFRPDTPDDVEQAIRNALTRDPAKRTMRAEDLRKTLRSALGKVTSVTYDDKSGPIRLPQPPSPTSPHEVQEPPPVTGAHTPVPMLPTPIHLANMADLASLEAFEPTMQAPPPAITPPPAASRAIMRTIPEAPAPVLPPPPAPAAPVAQVGGRGTPTTLSRASGVRISARPPRGKAAGLIAMAGLAALAAVVIVVAARSGGGESGELKHTDVSTPPTPASTTPTSPPAAVSTTPTSPPAAVSTTPVSPPAPVVVSVRLESKPEAVVMRGDEKLGKTPLAVQVEQGKRVRVRLRASGHRTADVELDGSTPTVTVKLVPARKQPERVRPLPIGL